MNISYKIDLLISWIILLFAEMSQAPVWVKTMSYILGSAAALTVIIRFIVDVKNNKLGKK